MSSYKGFFLFFILVQQVAGAQHHGASYMRLTEIPVLNLPAVDNHSLKEFELAHRKPGTPMRFATTHNVTITPSTHGKWVGTPVGFSTWRMKICSKDAYSLNLGFTQFQLPKGGEMKIYTPNMDSLIGKFTPADNEDHQQLWTPVFEGDAVILEITVPAGLETALQLELSHINHDFLGFSNLLSGDCHLDVVCAEKDGWSIIEPYRQAIRSTAVYGFDGTTFCTGVLVNNSRQDCSPYLLTAFHCNVDSQNAASVVVYWNYQNDTCRQPGTPASGKKGKGKLTSFNTGAKFLAGKSSSDFTLLLLDDPLPDTADLYFAGWDASASLKGDTFACVHHPQGEEKRISFDFDSLTLGFWDTLLTDGSDGNHLFVGGWELGATEIGSSGGPLFNDQQRLIGLLHGGEASCLFDAYDAFGRLHSSWNGGGERKNALKFWLDPDNLGIEVMDGYLHNKCNLYVRNISPGQYLCSQDTASFELLISPNFNDSIELSVLQIPPWLSYDVSSHRFAAGDVFTLKFYATNTLPDSILLVKIQVSDGIQERSADVWIRTFSTTPFTPKVPQAADTSLFINPPTLFWTRMPRAQLYELEISPDSTFADSVLLQHYETSDSVWTINGLENGGQYFWRVRAKNVCGTSNWTKTFSLQLADIVCLRVNGPELPLDLPAYRSFIRRSVIDLDLPGSIAFLSIDQLSIAHSWVGDLEATLQNSDGRPFPVFHRPGWPADMFGCQGNDIEVGFSDQATNPHELFEAQCHSSPAISGAFQPMEPFSAQKNTPARGPWQLILKDEQPEDGGKWHNWVLDICIDTPAEAQAWFPTREWVACAGQNINLAVLTGKGFINPSALEITGLPNQTIRPAAQNSLKSGTVVNFELPRLDNPGIFPLILSSQGVPYDSLVLTVQSDSLEMELRSPGHESSITSDYVQLEWSGAGPGVYYQLVLSRDPFEQSILIDTLLKDTFLLVQGLDSLKNYFWHVTAINSCGKTFESEIRKFEVQIISNTLGNSDPVAGFDLYPNPVSGRLQIYIHNDFSSSARLKLIDPVGRPILSLPMHPGQRRMEIDLGPYNPGVYFLSLETGLRKEVKKVVLH